LPTPEGYDACLGYLPGVDAACCGHGVTRGAIHYKDGHKEEEMAEFGCFDVDENVLDTIIEVNKEAFIRNEMLRKYGAHGGRFQRFILRFKHEHYRGNQSTGIKYKKWFGHLVITDVVFFPPLHPNCRCTIDPGGDD
jgi:hypothetical protein